MASSDGINSNTNMPVKIGATVILSKSLRHYLSNIPGKQKIKELQKQPYLELHTYYVKC
jgi:hypothetical protein